MFPFLLKLCAAGGYQGPEFRRALKKGLARANFETVNRLAHLEAAVAARRAPRAAAESPTPDPADAGRSPLVAHTR